MSGTFGMMKNDIRRTLSYNFNRKGTVKNKPHIFVIESTNHCNLNCMMCPRRHMTRKVEHMKLDTFKKIIDQSKGFVYEVGLDLFGEPLMCPDIFNMIRYAKDSGIKNVAMSTNATLLNESNAKKILESDLDLLVIDLDGYTKETYEKIRNGAKHDISVKNIMRFGEMKREYEKQNKKVPFVYLQIIRMKETENEIPEWIKFWEKYPFHLFVKKFNTWAQQDDFVTSLAKNEQKVKPDVKRYPCAWLWEQMIFTVNGDVVPCCADYDSKIILGNVNDNTVEEIWYGEKYRRLRELHKKGNYPSICGKCIEWKGHNRFAIWKDMKFIKNISLWKYIMNRKKIFRM